MNPAPTAVERTTSARLAAEWFLRIALSAGYLAAVADRFGGFGPSGSPNVAWGDWTHFQAYAATLNFWAPPSLQAALAWVATIAEIVLGVALLIPVGRRVTAFSSGILLTTFALAMTAALGPKAPLNYSVWTAAAASFLLVSSRNRHPAQETPTDGA